MKLRSVCLSFHRLRFFCPTLAAFSASGLVSGQEGVGSLPELPSGFYEAAATEFGESDEPRLSDLDLSLNFQTLYDTNVTQGNETNSRPIESDFIVQPTLNGSYAIGSPNWRLGINGTLGRITYLETDDFNATIYSAGLLAEYNREKVSASLKTNYADSAGVNRLDGALLEQKNFSSSLLAEYKTEKLRASLKTGYTEGVNRLAGVFLEQKNLLSSVEIDYRFSPKTSAEILLNQESTKNTTQGFADTSSNSINAGALWQATPLTRLGPGFRYRVITGFEDTEFTAAGPVLRANYKLSTKVNLSSSLGLDFQELPSGEDKVLNYRMGLTYRASQLWAANLRMVRDIQATLINGVGLDQISSFQFGYTRKIRRATLQLGVAYVNREPLGSSVVVDEFRDSTSIDYTASLGFPIIGDEVDLKINLAWREFTTFYGLQSWEGFQSGLSLAWRF